MWTRFYRRDPIRGAAVLGVLAFHLILFVIILISPTFTSREKTHKPLVVKTIVPTSTLKTPSSTPAPAKPKPQTPKPLAQKNPAAPAVVKKQVTKPAAPATKKEPAIADKIRSKAPENKPPQAPAQNRAKISDSLLHELEESIAKMEKKSDVKVLSKSIAPIALQIDSDTIVEESESNYSETLVSHLHRSLSLPDYGEVKIQLSLRQDGTVAKVVVLKAQSEKNKFYLESHLPRLQFPRFDGPYANKKECTFVLTFCNEL